MEDKEPRLREFDSATALEKLLQVGQSLVVAQDLDSLLRTIAESACSALEADVVVLYEYREDVDDVNVPPVVWGDIRRQDILEKRNGVKPHRESAVFKMLSKRRKKPFYASNARKDWARLMGEESRKAGRLGDFLTREDVASSAAVQLNADGERVGVLFVNYRTPHAFRDEEQKIIELFAAQAAVAIRNARLRADLERQVERLKTLNRVSLELSAELDSASIYEAVVEAAVDTLDCTHCTFFALENDLLVPRASHSKYGDAKVTRRFALGEGLAGKAARKGKSFLARDAKKLKAFVAGETRPEAERSIIVVPVKVDGQVIGVISADQDRANAFDERDLQMIETLALQAETAIQNENLLRQEQRRAEVMELLQRVQQDVDTAIGLQDVLDRILRRAVDSVGGRDGSLMLLEDGKLHFRARVGGLFPPNKEEHTFTPGAADEGIAGWVARNREPYVCRDTEANSKFVDIIAGPSIRSLASVPIISHGTVLGVINADSPEPDRFSEADAELLVALADQVAVAIERAELLESLRQIGEKTLGGAEDLHQCIVDAVHRLARCPVAIWRPDETGKRARIVAFRGIRPEYAQKAVVDLDRSVTGRAIREREIVQVLDIQADPDFQNKDVAAREGWQSYLAVPLLAGPERAVGTLSIYSMAKREKFTRWELNLLRAFAGQAAIATENARLFEESQNRLKLLDALHETSLDIIEQLRLEKLMPAIIERAANLMAGDHRSGIGAAYWRCDHKTQRAIIDYSPNPSLVGVELGFDEGLVGEVIQTGEAQYVNDYPQWPKRATIFDKGDLAGLIENIIEAPVKQDGKVVAILAISDASGQRLFGDADAELLKRFANLAAIAIQNARVHKQLQEELRQTKALYEIGQALSAEEMDYHNLLGLILERARGIIPFDFGGIALIDTLSKELVSERSIGLPEGIERPRTKIGEGIVGWVAKYGHPLLVGDVESVPEIPGIPERASYYPLDENTRSELCVPLRAKGEIIGVLNVESHRVRAFDEKDQEQLETLASQAAVAIENVRAYKYSQQQLSALLKVVKAIGAETDPLPVILEEAARLFRAEYGSFSLVDANTERLTYCAIWEKDRIVAGEQIPEEQREQSWEKGIVGHVAREGEAFRTDDVAKVPFYSKWYESTVSELAVPLKGMDGKMLGVLNLESPVRGAFSQMDEGLCQALAYVAAAALEKAGLFQELNERAARLERLQEITAAISAETSNLSKVLRLIVRRLNSIFKDASCQIRLYNSEADEFTNLVATGVLRNRSEAPRPDGTSRYVVETKKPRYLVEDELTNPSNGGPAVREEILDLGVKSIAYLPLQSEGNVIGILYVDLTTPYRFSKNDELILELFASQAAVAVENARHFKELRERAKRLKRLQEVTAAISAETSNLSKVLRLIVRRLNSIFKDASCQIRLYNSEADEFTNLVATGVLRNRSEAPRPDGTSRYVVETKKPRYLVEDELTNPSNGGPAVREEILDLGVKSIAYLPLQSEGNVIGILYVDLTAPRRFSESDRLILDLFASQAAVAVENARHFKELRERAKRLERLQEVTAAISAQTSDDPKKVLRLIVRSLSRIFKGASCQVRLYNAEADEFTSLAATGVLRDREVKIPRPSGTSRYIVETKVPRYLMGDELTSPSDGGPAVREEILKLGVKSIAYLPLQSEGNIIGILYVDLTDPYRFSENDDLILKLFASQAVVAIENARRREQRLSDITALQEINEAITTKEWKEIAALIAQRAQELTRADHGTLWLVNKEQTHLILEAPTADRLPGRLLIDEHRINGWVVLNKKPYKCDDVRVDPYYAEWYEGVRSSITVPLRFRDRVIGTLDAESTRLGAFSDYQLGLLQSLADQAAIAIENAKLIGRIQEQREAQIRAVQEIGRSIAAPMELEKVLDGILAWTVSLMGDANLGEIRLLDKSTDKLVVERFHGEVISEEYREVSVGQGIIGQAAQCRESQLVPDVRENKQYLPFLSGTRSELAVPMLRGEELVGVLNVEHPEVNAFTESDLKLAEAIAELAVVAIENARLYGHLDEMVQERTQQLAGLQRIGVKIASQLDLIEVLGSIVENANEITSADSSTVFVYDSDQGIFEDVGIRRGSIEDEPTVPTSRGLAARIAKTKQDIFIEDAEETPDIKSSFIRKNHIKSFAGIPLVIGERVVVGVLFVNFLRHHRFSKEERETIRLLANQAAVAVENARLYDQLDRERSELRSRLIDAERLLVASKFAASYIHRVNNLVGTIPIRVERIKEKLEQANALSVLKVLEPYLEGILNDARRVHPISKELAELTRQEPAKELVDVADSLARVARRILIETPAEIHLEEHYPEDRLLVHAVAWELSDAFWNVLKNGTEAMLPDGGSLSLRVAKILDEAGDAYVEIRIHNAGPKIPQGTLEHIFEPFRSTKGGTGYGLWRTRHVVQDLCGSISIENDENESACGVTAIIQLPIATEKEGVSE